MGYSLDRRNNKSDNRFEVNKIIYSVQLINPNKTKKEHNKSFLQVCFGVVAVITFLHNQVGTIIADIKLMLIVQSV